MNQFSRKILTLFILIALTSPQISFSSPLDTELEEKNHKGSLSTSSEIFKEEESLLDPSPSSWKDILQIPYLFVTSLFEPFTNQDAQDFYKSQLTQVQEEGITEYTSDKAKKASLAIKNHPLDAISLMGGLALGYTDMGEYTPAIEAVVITANRLKNGKSLINLAQSVDGQALVNKGLKLALIGGVVYIISSVPTAAAYDWNNLKDAEDHYSGGACPKNPWERLMTPATNCISEGGNLNTCRALIPEGPETDLYVFTRHPSSDESLNPVSITKLHDDMTCFYTALRPDSPVTRTCFPDPSDPSVRSVERALDMNLMRAHMGLKPGMSKEHIGMRFQGRECGYFHEGTAKSDVGEDATCLYTALKPGEEVTQLCYDPKNPESLVLMKAEDVELKADESMVFKEDGNPISFVIKRKALNLLPQDTNTIKPDVTPDKPNSVDVEKPTPSLKITDSDPDTCIAEQKSLFSHLWDAYQMWSNQVNPCDKVDDKEL